MKNLKFIPILIVGLFISNIVLLGMLFFRNPPHPQHEGPRKIIIEKLKLADKQIKEYEGLIQIHRNKITDAQKEIMQLKTMLYSKLADTQNQVLTDSLLIKINFVQKEIENTHYQHFLDIKKICRPDQQQAFENLTKEMAVLFSPPPMREKKK